MAYIPTEWKNGDTITAEKLNKLEEGVVDTGNVLVINIQLHQDNSTNEWILDSFDSTRDAIFQAHQVGKAVIAILKTKKGTNDSIPWNYQEILIDSQSPYYAGGTCNIITSSEPNINIRIISISILSDNNVNYTETTLRTLIATT